MVPVLLEEVGIPDELNYVLAGRQRIIFSGHASTVRQLVAAVDERYTPQPEGVAENPRPSPKAREAAWVNMRELNKEAAREASDRLSSEVRRNLAKYSQWLWERDFLEFRTTDDYSAFRSRLPDWSRQAKDHWIRELTVAGVLELDENESGLTFSDVGVELLFIV